jgi:predicted ATP-dependent endonuclease of OLD family
MVIFPSERTGFSTISLIDYKKTPSGTSRTYTKLEEEKPRLQHNISIPVGSILDIINDYLSLENQEELLKQRLKNLQTSKFVQCGDLFQNEILHGSLTKSKPTANNYTEILYKYDNTVELDMYAVSSMVKASTPLVIYLKYFAEKGDLIIIDEPEMNLHPKAQAQFAEFLGLLANFGLKIIITTHSTFFVDHFANLIKASKKRNKKDIAKLFFLKNPDAFIHQKDIGAYLFENNTVRNILSEKGLIDWDTFSVISEQLSDIYFKMDDKNAL